MNSKKKKVYCPQCRQPTPRDAEHFPFCSKRCRLLDLGQWFGGNYRVAGEKVNPEAYPEDENESI